MFKELPQQWGSFLVAYGENGKNLIYTLFKPSLTFVHFICYICTGINLRYLFRRQFLFLFERGKCFFYFKGGESCEKSVFTAITMSFVGLFLSGAVLFLNGLMLLGKADGKAVGYFNLFVGIIQIINPFYLIMTSSQGNWDLYNNAAIFLFGLTYLYVGVTSVKGLEGNGLGWFSLWVSIIAVVYTVISFVQFDDVVNGLTWGLWAFLWSLFFLTGSLNKKIDGYVGMVAIVLSWVTLTIPAMLYFLGVWNTPAVQQIWTWVLILTIVFFVISLLSPKLSFKKEKSGQEVQAA
jgi:putative amide transporter protein